MNWGFRLSADAAKQLRRLPRDRQEQITRVMEQMRSDPFGGDAVPLKGGKFRGSLRRRVGRYRILFSIDLVERVINVGAIVPRTERTYR